jgi:hypothetical protein
VVVRFYTPETGGVAEPRFIGERTLTFEARLDAMRESPDGLGADYDARRVRTAVDHHIGEELLASLATKLIAGSPPDRRPTETALAAIEKSLTAELFDRLGGQARVEAAALAEQLSPSEVGDLVRREALAAWYVDRAVTPILRPTEEQLREVSRTAAHPFRGRPFDEVRPQLERWFIAERLRAAESSFMQGARSRLRVFVVP